MTAVYFWVWVTTFIKILRKGRFFLIFIIFWTSVVFLSWAWVFQIQILRNFLFRVLIFIFKSVFWKISLSNINRMRFWLLILIIRFIINRKLFVLSFPRILTFLKFLDLINFTLFLKLEKSLSLKTLFCVQVVCFVFVSIKSLIKELTSE